MRQDAHGGVVLQLADEHDAADGGSNVDGAETSLQALHSSGLVQMPDQQNSAACSLRYLSQPHEDGAHFVCPVHIHVGTEICLDRVDDDQSGVVLDYGFWSKEDRRQAYEKASRLTGDIVFHQLNCNENTARKRVLERSRTDENELFIDENCFNLLLQNYEPITADEHYNVISHRQSEI